MDYVWANVNFDEVVGELDRDEHTIGTTGFSRIQPKTDLLAHRRRQGDDVVRGVNRRIAVATLVLVVLLAGGSSTAQEYTIGPR